MDFINHYAILGIERTAPPAGIKKAYWQAAMRYHPDRNPNDKAAEEKFKAINAANECLSDPVKRQEYDLLLSKYEGGPSPEPARPQEAPGSNSGRSYETLDELRKTAMNSRASAEDRMDAGFCFVTNCWDDAELFAMAASKRVLNEVREAAAIKYAELSENYQNLLILARTSEYGLVRSAAWTKCATSDDIEILYEVALSGDADLVSRKNAGLKYAANSGDYDKLLTLMNACNPASALGEVFDAAYGKCMAMGMTDGRMTEIMLNKWYQLAADVRVDSDVRAASASRYIDLSDNYAGLLSIARNWSGTIGSKAGNKCLNLCLGKNDLDGVFRLAADIYANDDVRTASASKYIELSDNYAGLLSIARNWNGTIGSKAGNKCLNLCLGKNDLDGVFRLAANPYINNDVREKARTAGKQLEMQKSQNRVTNPLAGDGLVLSDTSFMPKMRTWARNLTVRVKDGTKRAFSKIAA